MVQPLGVRGVGEFYKIFLLGYEWNSQIYTQKSMLPTPTPMIVGWGGGQYAKNVFSKNWMKCPDQQIEVMFDNTFSPSKREQFKKNIFARK